jgi:triacylglycerol esterase/lipase EstA (alpha/beta hydrolase family)
MTGPVNNQNSPNNQPFNATSKTHSFIEKIKNFAAWLFKLILNTVIEIGAMITCAATFAFLQTRKDPKQCVDTGDHNKDIPIILVHGYLHNSSGWLIHRKLLNQAGYKNVFTVNLGSIPFGKTIENHYAKVLEARVNEVMAMSNINEVRFIAHSMGGLVSSEYALHLKPDNITVKDIITLSSPLYGTKMAHLGPGECARQMCDKNTYNQNLSAEIASNEEINFHHFGSETDLIVSKKSALNGATIHEERENNLYNYDGGHVSILFSKKVNRQIVDILEDVEQD